MSASDLIQVSTQDHIKTITLNQPKRKNALSNAMAQQLLAEIQATAEDDSRVVILTGAEGDFCAGADLDPQLINGQGFDVTDFLRDTYTPLVLGIRQMNKPFIARVRGNCVGVGFNFAMACDLVYASEDARFSQIFTRIGLSTDGGGAYFMLAKLGHHKAFELMATHAMLSAEEAAQYGLINHALPADQLDPAVGDMARRLAEGPYVAIQHTKANLRAAQDGLAAALDEEAVNQGKNFRTQDFFEGVMAFLQKRSARFKGQ
jgi:2-(1,2-epoxy-1,2-dihydrophenyl)acetyl-CoA isomerase